MRPFSTTLALVIVALGAAARSPANPDVHVYFSPRGGCTDAVVSEISAARSSIYVQAHSFTSAPIAKALTDAHARGVHVEVILDKSDRSERYSAPDFVYHAGIPTFIDVWNAHKAHSVAYVSPRGP